MDGSILHAALLRSLAGLLRRDGGLPTSVGGASEIEPTAIAALALDSTGRARLAREAVAAGRRLRRGRRTPATARRRRRWPRSRSADPGAHGVRLPTRSPAAGFRCRMRPTRASATAWGWTGDARSLVEPTARVLLAVNALTPGDATTRGARPSSCCEPRQCADGGWNFGNASVYDVDLRGYAQTTAMGLIALQNGHPAGSSRARSASCRATGGSSRAG